ncbi:unnamed protein product, partial [Ceratitis capitata]
SVIEIYSWETKHPTPIYHCYSSYCKAQAGTATLLYSMHSGLDVSWEVTNTIFRRRH